MKKIIVLLAALLIVASVSVAFAEEYSGLSIDELKLIRNEKIADLNAVNTVLGQKLRTAELADTNNEEATVSTTDELPLGKIKDLFPDKALAKYVRDKVGKISIEQSVTQAELDKIDSFRIMQKTEYGDISDLTGIGLLRNLEQFGLYNSVGCFGTELPEEFYTLTKLRLIAISSPSFTTLSESLGNFTSLVYLDIGGTGVASLPNSIGNLTALKSLDISHTKIKELPDSIWALQLDTIEMQGLPIE